MCKDVTISEIKEAQRICLERGIPFLHIVYLIVEISALEHKYRGEVAGNCSPSVFLEDSGFCFLRFMWQIISPVRFLRNDIDLSKAGDLDILKVTPKKKCAGHCSVGEIGKGIYIKQAERVISALRSGKIRKAVLSRVRQFFCDPYKKLRNGLTDCARLIPMLFVFLVSIPGETLWMGATRKLFYVVLLPVFKLCRWPEQREKTIFLNGGEKDRGGATDCNGIYRILFPEYSWNRTSDIRSGIEASWGCFTFMYHVYVE